MNSGMNRPYHVANVAEIESPALLIFLPIVRANLEAMISLAGATERLRPHVKTHKMPALVRLLEARGIHKHKCATIAEAEMIAQAGGRDVLVAYPLVGPNVERFCRLGLEYAATTFRATVDHPDAARLLARASIQRDSRAIPTLVDVDIGMGRTGVAPDAAQELYELISNLPGLEPDGLHAYDGHQRDSDFTLRRNSAQSGIAAIEQLHQALTAGGYSVPRVVLGGTPTFPVHAWSELPNVEFSPGTCLLHDHSYQSKFPDLPFQPAALLLGRVISRPRPGRVCIDIGSKAVAADPAGDRVRLIDVEGATLGPQSEEHLVLTIDKDDQLPLGATVLAVPTHICPTCALHREALVIDEHGALVDRWQVAARDRHLQI